MFVRVENRYAKRRMAAILTAFLAVSLSGVFSATSATAAASVASGHTSETIKSGDAVFVITQNGEPIAEFALSEATPAEVALLQRATKSVLPSASGGMTPQARIGLGLFIYVYLNQRDVNTIMQGGITAAGTLLCTPGGAVAAAACGVMASLIAEQITASRAMTIPAGHCLEMRFSYAGVLGRTVIFSGSKFVRTSC